VVLSILEINIKLTMTNPKHPSTSKGKWIWMPHAGHLIVSSDCRFHLNTYVGGYIVSTVGEYFPDEGVREIFAESRGVNLEGC